MAAEYPNVIHAAAVVTIADNTFFINGSGFSGATYPGEGELRLTLDTPIAPDERVVMVQPRNGYNSSTLLGCSPDEINANGDGTNVIVLMRDVVLAAGTENFSFSIVIISIPPGIIPVNTGVGPET